MCRRAEHCELLAQRGELEDQLAPRTEQHREARAEQRDEGSHLERIALRGGGLNGDEHHRHPADAATAARDTVYLFESLDLRRARLPSWDDA